MPVGGKADHLVQEIGVRGILKQRLKLHPVVSYCGLSYRSGLCLATKPYREPASTSSNKTACSYTTPWDATRNRVRAYTSPVNIRISSFVCCSSGIRFQSRLQMVATSSQSSAATARLPASRSLDA